MSHITVLQRFNVISYSCEETFDFYETSNLIFSTIDRGSSKQTYFRGVENYSHKGIQVTIYKEWAVTLPGVCILLNLLFPHLGKACLFSEDVFLSFFTADLEEQNETTMMPTNI